MFQQLRPALWLLMCVLVACTGSRCDGSKGAESKGPLAVRKPAPDLRLLVLTDPRGYLEPCGCQMRPLGGLDKLATVVSQVRGDGAPTLVLAAGNIAFGTELRPEDAAEASTQERYRAETFAEVYRRIGVAAVTPGPLDLVQDEELVRKVVGLSGLPWIVDNAATGEEQTHPFATGRVLEAQGVKVGVLGLAAPVEGSAAAPPWLPRETELAEVAKQKSEALRKQGAQIVVALMSGDRRAARTVAQAGPDIVVMGGLDLEQALPPTVAGEAVLVHAGQQGQHVLALELGGLTERGAWEDASAWSAREEKRELTQQVESLSERIRGWEKDESVAKQDLDRQRARLRELEQQRDAERSPTYAGRWLRAELTDLAPEVPGEPKIAALLDAHDRRVNEHNRVTLADKKPRPAPEGAAVYAGSTSCASCHAQAYDWWRSTQHGNAYATLEKVHKEFNLNCVACHVTGYNEPGGSTVTHVESLKDVGCESCHGPGSLHNASPERAGLVARAVPESTCKTCHTPEHSSRFVYDAFKAMLIVPGHGRPLDRQ